MMHFAEKSNRKLRIYTHSISYYFGRREHEGVQFVNGSVLLFHYVFIRLQLLPFLLHSFSPTPHWKQSLAKFVL